MKTIWIKEININGNHVEYCLKVSDDLKKYFAPECKMFVDFEFDISSIPESVLTVPVLSNLMQFAWLFDCLLWVKEVDRTFYACLPRIKQAFQEMYPDYTFGGSLIAAKIVDNTYPIETEAVQLFTGGVDATATFLRIRNTNPVLVDTYGWLTRKSESSSVLEADRAAIDSFARENHVETAYISSNFATFLDVKQVNKEINKKVHNTWWFGFQHSLAFLGVASIVAFYYHARNIYIASSYTFEQVVNCVSDPRIDNQFAVASCTTIHDGYELSRQQKVKAIVDAHINDGLNIKLRVCSFREKNCNNCEKCFRTMLAIIAEGGDINEYGFSITTPFLIALKGFLHENVRELDHDHIVFWQNIITRMGENYDGLFEKEVYDYLKDFDFEREKKIGLLRYYRVNFFSILKRKLKGVIKRG